jgi:lysophospholipase L1-like esterase
MLSRRALFALFAQQKKLVILLGDSIRLGYQATVINELAGVAEVWAPAENGAHTANLLVQLSTWVLPRNAAVIHVNAGLHDLKTLHYDTRELVVPLKHYRDNVETLLRTMRQKTSAKLIWATTTMVNDEGSRQAREKNREFRRYNSDVEAYNRAAVKVCRKLHVPVNDLYALSRQNAARQMPDGVHFTPEGYQVLGHQVANEIRQTLGA